MGAILEQIYAVVTKKGGFKGRLRLAVKTGIPRIKVGQMKDSEEIVQKFKKAADEILEQDISPFLNGGE